MDEKDKNPIIINELLDQFTKSSNTPSQGGVSQPQNFVKQQTPAPSANQPKPILPNQNINLGSRPISPPSSFEVKKPSPYPFKLSPQTEVKLPSLGQKPEPSSRLNNSYQLTVETPTESKLKLSIRTMASDIQNLKKGQRPLAEEIGKSVVKNESNLQKTQTIPPLKPVSKLTSPTPYAPPKTPVEEHHHTEKIISGEKISTDNKDSQREALPSFLDTRKLKQISKPEGEKIEYGLIAKVIGSGLTTGIISTVIVALAAYFIISYLFFREEDVVVSTPTPTVTTPPPVSEVNEIKSIFSDTTTTDFELPEQSENTITALRSFIESRPLEPKEFQILNILGPSRQPVLFKDILTVLADSFPSNLADFIEENNMILIYGQEESFSKNKQASPLKRLVFIVEITDSDMVKNTLRQWEPTLPIDLKNIFDLDLTKSVTQNFLDNELRGTPIRYKNFPFPDKSIDYSIVSSLTGRKYLIITNSRESMYSPIEKIRGL